MTDGGRYSRVVLTCIVLTLGVSYAVPDALYLCATGFDFCCEVKSERATAHSGLLKKFVEGEEPLTGPVVLERVANKELRLFAHYIATVHANDGDSIGDWVRDNLPTLDDRMRMLKAAQYLQMDALERYIESMEYTCAEFAWIRLNAHLDVAKLKHIVGRIPAYNVLHAADVFQDSIPQKKAIVKAIRTLLITGRGDINLVNYGHFNMRHHVLYWATDCNHPEIVELLLSIPGVAVTQMPSHDFVSPLQIAAFDGHTRLVELLLRFPGIEVDAGAGTSRGTALHVAAIDKTSDEEESDGIRIVQLLIGHGANVDAVNEDGSTALHGAVQDGRTGIVKVLLDHGANVNAVNKDGSTALHVAVQDGRAGIVKVLLDHGANVNAVNKDGSTALHVAVQDGRMGIFNVLLDHGPNDNTVNIALHVAVRHGQTRIVKKLLDHVANVDAVDKDGSTALRVAAWYGWASIVKVLLDHGANADAVDKDGRTALHVAVESGLKDIVEVLLDNGADIYQQDKQGRTPLHVAVNSGQDAHRSTGQVACMNMLFAKVLNRDTSLMDHRGRTEFGLGRG